MMDLMRKSLIPLVALFFVVACGADRPVASQRVDISISPDGGVVLANQNMGVAPNIRDIYRALGEPSRIDNTKPLANHIYDDAGLQVFAQKNGGQVFTIRGILDTFPGMAEPSPNSLYLGALETPLVTINFDRHVESGAAIFFRAPPWKPTFEEFGNPDEAVTIKVRCTDITVTGYLNLGQPKTFQIKPAIPQEYCAS